MLFLSLDSFLHTGGLEKFNCCFLKALQELSSEAQVNAKAASMYDISCDEKYFSKKNYKAYNGKKWLFVLQSIIAGLKCNTLILGHVNLALIGIAVKKLNPSIKLILIVHGIDIWQQQTGLKKKLLEITDEVWSVSNYTKHVLLQNNCYVKAEKIRIFPNTIDPFFSLPKKFDKPAYLLQRYGIKANTKVIVTVTRLTSTEKFKGYDNIIAILKSININSAEPIHYILCGKTDIAELNRINQLIKQFNAEAYITLTGFVKVEELTDHYLLADVFVLPSKKEGFGIVFIEAMACGLPVIAGNKDGSVDALMNGELGTLIDPDNELELLNAITASLNNETHNPLALQQKVVANFGFEQYKKRLKNYLEINN